MRENFAILIVDDEESIRLLLQAFLSSKYDCTVVDSAESALSALKSKPFDLVLLDMCLTSISGLELCPMIKERWPRTVVAMMTGFRSSEAREKALRGGVSRVLYKPFDLSEVAAAVESASGHRGQ